MAEDKKKATFSSYFHLADLGLIPGTRMVGAKAVTEPSTSLHLAQRSGISNIMVNPPFYQVRAYLGKGA